MSIRNKFLIPLTMGVSLFFVSCISYEKKLLEEIQEHPIVFPEELSAISYKDSLEFASVFESGAKLVIYVDSSECNSCFIGHLYKYAMVQSRLPDCRVMVIVSPSETEKAQVVHQLAHLAIDIPVFLDEKHNFRHANPYIPDDRRYQSFFLDTGNTPFIVGDPLYYPKLIQLYLKEREMLAK